jgi:hypothetical protein
MFVKQKTLAYISCYVCEQEGVFRRLFNYSNAHPWLYAVYVLVIALPMVLIFTFCCGSSQVRFKHIT